VLAAFLYGLDTVEQCIKDPLIFKMMQKGIFEEIIPSMDGDNAELVRYANDVLERFANPYIRHLLLSISLNSVSKFKTRVLPSLAGFSSKTGKLPQTLVFSLAALIAFYKGGNLNGRVLTGGRNGEPYSIEDDEEVVKRFAALYAEGGEAAWASLALQAGKIAHGVLSSADWWGEDLTARAGLEDAVAANLEAIWKQGIKSVIEGLV
jgi:tagaturonate reductase